MEESSRIALETRRKEIKKMTSMINKTVDLKDWNGRKTGDWGIIKDFDGEYFWIAFAGDENDVKPYTRSEFVAHRERKGA